MNTKLIVGIVVILVVILGGVVVFQQKETNETSVLPQDDATDTVSSDTPSDTGENNGTDAPPTDTKGDTPEDTTGSETGAEESPTTGKENVVAHIDEEVSALGVTVTPLEVTEDSRCPSGVECFWAGTVRVRVHLSGDAGGGEEVLTLNEPFATDGVEITLVDVEPEAVSMHQITPDEYSLTFMIEKS